MGTQPCESRTWCEYHDPSRTLRISWIVWMPVKGKRTEPKMGCTRFKVEGGRKGDGFKIVNKHMFTYSHMCLLCGNWTDIGNLWFKPVCSLYTNHWCVDGVLLLKSTTLYILMGMITIHELGLYNPFTSNQLAIIPQNDMSRFERGAHKTSSEYSTTLPHEQTGR